MIYNAFLIKEFKDVDSFDTSKHTSEEFEEWKKQYPPSKGFTITHTEKNEE